MNTKKKIFHLLLIALVVSCKSNAPHQHINASGESIRSRTISPTGYFREDYDKSTYQHFLQNLNLLPNGSKVLDFKGNPIANQSSHVGIINYDIGKKDLQQCADAIIRLRAEYLYGQQKFNDIQFKFTSGHNYKG